MPPSKKKESISMCHNLKQQIIIANSDFKKDTSSNLNKLTKPKYEFNPLLTQKAEFSLFRARQKFFEEGNKAGKLQARYAKGSYEMALMAEMAMSAISAISAEDGSLLSDPEYMNVTFSNFYMDLYSSESYACEDDIKKILPSLDLPKVPPEQLDALDSAFTFEEIVGVIDHLPSGKAPGLDGFMAEFYKSFPGELPPLLLNMYNESFVKGMLPPSLSEALITLILKKDKDPSDCKNYRPISLTSYDSKILSKLLANRLNRVITSLIHPDQVGYICSRVFF